MEDRTCLGCSLTAPGEDLFVIYFVPCPPYKEDGGKDELHFCCGLCVEPCSSPTQELLSLHDPVYVSLPDGYHEYDHWLRDQRKAGRAFTSEPRTQHFLNNHN